MARAADFLAFYHWSFYARRHDQELNDAAEVRFARQNLEIQERLSGKGHPSTARAHAYLASALLHVAEGDDEEYMAHAAEAIALARVCAQPESAAFATIIVAPYFIGRDTKLAEAEMIQAAELITRTLGSDPFELGWTYHMIGHFNYFSSAEVKLTNAIKADDAVANVLVRYHPFRLHMQSVVAQNTDPDEGVRILERITQTSAERYGERHEETFVMLGRLAAAYERAQRSADAARTYHRVLEGRRSTLGESHPSLRLTLHDLGELHRNLGEFPEALRWFEQEAQITTDEASVGCHDELRPFRSMSEVAKQLGDIKAAAAYAERGIRACEGRGIRNGDQAAGVEGMHVAAAKLFVEIGELEKASCHLRSAELRRAQGAKTRKEPVEFDSKRIAGYRAELADLNKRGGFTLSDKRCEALTSFARNAAAPL